MALVGAAEGLVVFRSFATVQPPLLRFKEHLCV